MIGLHSCGNLIGLKVTISLRWLQKKQIYDLLAA